MLWGPLGHINTDCQWSRDSAGEDTEDTVSMSGTCSYISIDNRFGTFRALRRLQQGQHYNYYHLQNLLEWTKKGSKSWGVFLSNVHSVFYGDESYYTFQYFNNWTEVGTQRNFNINFHFLVPGPDFMEITKLNCFKLNWQKNCFKGSWALFYCSSPPA